MPENKRRAEAIWVEARKRWQVNVQVDGTRKTLTSSKAGRAGKAEAERKADVWIADHGAEESSRFWPVFLAHLSDVQIRTGRGNYTNQECNGRIWLKPRLENKKLKNITTQDWQDCINDAAKAGRALKTLKDIRGTISSFCRYCKKRRIRVEDTALIDIPKGAPVGEKTILQPEQLRILFTDATTRENGHVCEAYYINLWRWIVLTGERRGEGIGMWETDINTRTGIVHVQRSINKFNDLGPTKTDAGDRKFVLTRHMRRVLDDQRALKKRLGIVSKWVFCDSDGGESKSATVYDRWCLYCKYHGFKTTLHELRHTLISIAKTSISAPMLKPMVGHTESMPTYDVYGHEVDGDMQFVADALDALFDKHLKAPEEGTH